MKEKLLDELDRLHRHRQNNKLVKQLNEAYPDYPDAQELFVTKQIKEQLRKTIRDRW